MSYGAGEPSFKFIPSMVDQPNRGKANWLTIILPYHTGVNSSQAIFLRLVSLHIENEVQTSHDRKIVHRPGPRLHLLYSKEVILQHGERTKAYFMRVS